MPQIHQRRQHIISNTPDATNPVQTILQPDIPHPPRLNTTLPIPSMVRMAPAQRAPSLTARKLTAIVKPASFTIKHSAKNAKKLVIADEDGTVYGEVSLCR